MATDIQRKIDSLQQQLDALRKEQQQSENTSSAPKREIQSNQPQSSVSSTSKIPYRLRVDAQLVSVNAVVRNHHGKIVLGLKKEDFELSQDGQPQSIRYFNADSDMPLTLGLMVDTSGSLRKYRHEEESAATIFLAKMLTRPQDRALVKRFDSHDILLQSMTSNISDLNKSLGKLDAPQKSHRSDRGTRLYDAICKTLNNDIGHEEGRRALIILTDGKDNGSDHSLDDAAQCAQSTGVAIFTILFPNDYVANGEKPTAYSGNKPMDQIADESGGLVFLINNEKGIGKAFDQIAQILRSFYRLSFTPPDSIPGTHHSLQVHMKSPKLIARARTGYITPQPLNDIHTPRRQSN